MIAQAIVFLQALINHRFATILGTRKNDAVAPPGTTLFLHGLQIRLSLASGSNVGTQRKALKHNIRF
jgi:hypothetical protein